MEKLTRAEKTRREILDRAWELIADKGADVSMADIARAAGVTRQSVYLHFKSRGGLLVALTRRADERERIIENFVDAMEKQPVNRRLEVCLGLWFDFVPKIHPVATDLIRLRSQDAEADHAWTDRMKDLHNLFRLLMQGLKEKKALSSDWSVDEAADYVWAAVSVQSWDLLVSDRGWSPARASDRITRTLCETLLAPTAARQLSLDF